MGVGVYSTLVTIGYLGIGCFHATASITLYLESDVSLRSEFNCNTALILRLFVPNSLTAYHHSLLSEVPVRDVTFLGLILIFFNLHSGGWSPNWVHSARRPFIGLLYLSRVIVRRVNLVEWIGRGNRSTRRKPAPAPLCPTHIPLDQIRARTRATTVGSQRLTAWAMARPTFLC
jgi:hypothetical protein